MINRLFSPRNIFLIAAALALILSVLACYLPLAAATPAPATQVSEAPVSTAAVAPLPTQEALVVTTPTAVAEIAVPPAILEARRLTLEYPHRMRAGVESDVVRLTLEVDNLGNITPTAQIEGNVVVGNTIEIPDLYDTHNVTAEAQLDLAGVEVRPPDAIFEPLNRGQSVTFYWSIRPQETGTYRGTVWLHLNFADKSTGEKSRIAVSAQIIEIEAVDFFGLSVNLARTSGVIGSVVGGVVGFPFLEEILKFLFKRRRGKEN